MATVKALAAFGIVLNVVWFAICARFGVFNGFACALSFLSVLILIRNR